MQVSLFNFVIISLWVLQLPIYLGGRPVSSDQKCIGGHSTNRIVGGRDAAPNSVPFQLVLRIRRSPFSKKVRSSLCGAILLAPSYALTAGHCVHGRPLGTHNFTVTAGDHDLKADDGTEQIRYAVQIFLHPHYRDISNDIAILQLNVPFNLTDNVQPIDLPPASYRARGDAIVSGWGCIFEDCQGHSSRTLQVVNVPIISDQRCSNQYPHEEILENVICAGYAGGQKDACSGDSGGPLFKESGSDCKKLLVGIVSWGEGCARPGKPGVYTEVAYFRGWIDTILKENKGKDDGWSGDVLVKPNNSGLSCHFSSSFKAGLTMNALVPFLFRNFLF